MPTRWSKPSCFRKKIRNFQSKIWSHFYSGLKLDGYHSCEKYVQSVKMLRGNEKFDEQARILSIYSRIVAKKIVNDKKIRMSTIFMHLRKYLNNERRFVKKWTKAKMEAKIRTRNTKFVLSRNHWCNECCESEAFFEFYLNHGILQHILSYYLPVSAILRPRKWHKSQQDHIQFFPWVP